jgi:hypothetical protein
MRPEDGTFAWKFLKSFGGGLYRVQKFTNKISVKKRVNYSQKGFRNTKHVYVSPLGGQSDEQSNNKLHYLGLDGLFQYRISKTNLQFFVGPRIDYLLGTNLPSKTINPQSYRPILREDFREIVLGIVGGIEMQIDKRFSIDLGVNRDFTPALRYPDLLIKNWLWSLNLSMKIRSKDVHV